MCIMRQHRVKKELTLRQIAEETNVSESYICLIESGARRPSVQLAKRIADVLGFDWTRFYEENEKS